MAVAIALVMAIAMPWTSSINIISKDPFRDNTTYLFTAGGLLVVGILIMSHDKLMGLFATWATVSSIWSWSYIGLAIAHWITLGCVVILVAKQATKREQRWFVNALLFSAILQIVYATHQLFGYDIFYLGGVKKSFTHIHGTFGYHSYLGIYLAMVAPLAPIVLLPFFLYGLILSKSVMAFAACVIGLLVTHRKHLKWWHGPLTFVFSSALLSILLWHRGSVSLETVASRFEAWRLGLATLENWLFGHGFGTWYTTIPKLQVGKYVGTIEMFEQAHNEFVQLLFEGGLVAVFLVITWLLHNYRVFTGSWGGSIVVLMIMSMWLFPFHLASLAAISLVITGMALGEETYV